MNGQQNIKINVEFDIAQCKPCSALASKNTRIFTPASDFNPLNSSTVGMVKKNSDHFSAPKFLHRTGFKRPKHCSELSILPGCW